MIYFLVYKVMRGSIFLARTAITLQQFYINHPQYTQKPDYAAGDPVWQLAQSSTQKIRFRCHTCGYTYQATVKTKLYKLRGCPVCAGKAVDKDTNSLAVVAPELAKEWSPQNDKTPFEVTAKSAYRAWWVCSTDPTHTWQTPVSERNRTGTSKKGTGCPYCAKEKARRLFAQRKRAGKNTPTDLILPGGSNTPQYMNTMINETTQPISTLSSVEIDWECDKGHVFTCSPRGFLGACPVCNKDNTRLSLPRIVFRPDTRRVQVEEYENQTGGPIVERFETLPVGGRQRLCFVCPHGHQFTRRRSGFRFECPVCANVGKTLKFRRPDLYATLAHKDEKGMDALTYNSAKKVEWVCDRGHTWVAAVYQRVNSGSGCPLCSPVGWSQAEKEIATMVRSWGLSVSENDTTVIDPYEVDIFVPGKNIAIEYNGLYWHSDMFHDSTYHYNKWKMCADKGVQLITVWEDDWLSRKAVVASMLRHKLGVDDSPRVYARKTTVKKIDYQTARTFLDMTHIQGAAAGTMYYGLVDHTGTVVAVSVWKKTGVTMYLSRYATSCTVVGGMGKILNHVKCALAGSDVDTIVTFSDHGVSDGSLYKTLGFHHGGELPPDYKYVYGGERAHKFLFRKSRFRTDPNLIFDPGLTEKQLADRNGIRRVFDCGKTRWVLGV